MFTILFPKKEASIVPYISSGPEPLKPTNPLVTPPGKIPGLKPERSLEKDQAYVVKKGDSLSRIARKYGLTTKHLINYNKISPRSILRIGQKIIIPGKYAIKDLKNEKPLALSGDVYIVQPDDNLWVIAKRSGVSWKELKRINSLTDTSILRVGQKILLRRGENTKIVNEPQKPIAGSQDNQEENIPKPSEEVEPPIEPTDPKINQEISDEEFNKIQKRYTNQGYDIWLFMAVEGQTIADIAKHWDVDKKILLEANPHIKDGVPIKANVKIIVPIKY